MPTTLFSDTFTDTNGTALASHTPTIGTSWAEFGAGGNYAIQSNACRYTRSASTYRYAIATASGTPNTCVVEATIIDASPLSYAGGIVFCWTDANNHYGLRWNQFGNIYQLYKVAAGTETVIVQSGGSANPTGALTLKAVRNGSAIDCYVNGAIPAWASGATDGTFSGGKSGLGVLSAGTSLDFDDFSWVDATAPAVSRALANNAPGLTPFTRNRLVGV